VKEMPKEVEVEEEKSSDEMLGSSLHNPPSHITVNDVSD
jgi:hypothetical protein